MDFLDSDLRDPGPRGMVAFGMLDGHSRHCLITGRGGPEDPDKRVAELMGARRPTPAR